MNPFSKLALGALAATVTSCGVPPPHEASASKHAMSGTPLPGACEAPSADNQGKMGCYFDQAIDVGALPTTAFWHVDEFPDYASAMRSKGPASVVVRAYGRIFLQTVNGQERWRPKGGRHLATVGPMKAPQGETVTARFMQAMTQPGATTRPHIHDGPEAFYLLSEAICMETPSGIQTTSAGQTYLINGGMPMQLISAGKGVRRSIFVVLHRSSQPWMTMAVDWKPTGACARSG